MTTIDNVCYGSLGTFNSIHRPSRRKKVLSFILAALGTLLCAALIFSGKSLFLSSSVHKRLSELLATQKPFEFSRPEAQLGSIANWGNQTPTAKVYARHSPVRDGVINFYLNFPSGSSKLRAPQWFMGIPVEGRRTAALKQVEIAFLNGQINHLPAASMPSSSSNRKLLELTKRGPSKFASKTQQTAVNPTSDEEESSAVQKVSSPTKVKSSSTSRAVNCCLPSCAQHKKNRKPFHRLSKLSNKSRH